MKIVLASHNKKKINELRVLLSEYKEWMKTTRYSIH